MHVGGISSGSFAAMAAGLRTGMRLDAMEQGLENAGLLATGLSEAIEAAQAQADAVTHAGAMAARMELSGRLVDLLA